MKRGEYRKVVKFIVNNFNNNVQPLDEYVVKILPHVVRSNSINLTEDEYIHDLCGGNLKNFETFIKILEQIISTEKGLSRVCLRYDPPVYYLEETEFGEKVITSIRDRYLNKLKGILNNEYQLEFDKGEFFETFCSYFLKDLGIQNWVTRKSKDEGIDIIGIISGKPKELRDLVFNNEQFLLVQVKYHTNIVDKSVIRNLIGDSYFYKHEPISRDKQKFFIGAAPVSLLVIAFSGFSERAEQFACRYNVEILDGNKVLDVLCSIGDHKSSALRFLNSTIMNFNLSN